MEPSTERFAPGPAVKKADELTGVLLEGYLSTPSFMVPSFSRFIPSSSVLLNVSLMVTSVTGARVVLDNGHVLAPALTGGVAPYTEFAKLVDRNWTGETPAWAALAGR